VFLHPVGSAGQVQHSGASEAQNIDALFFMILWDRYRFHKKHAKTHYTEHVFLHPVGSTGHVVHSRAFRHETPTHYFSCLGANGTNSTKSVLGHITPNLCFASGGICGSRNAFRCVQGTKRRCTISQAQLGPVWFP
jgi:hypothetical protein